MQQHSSNTSSRAYKAIKYSRLYPSSNEAASQQAPEWQHYRGPSLRVILDITKTPPLNDPSYRLRIIMETDGHSGAQPTPYAVGQGTPDIVLENLDLSAFSDLDQTLSPALKAVFTSATVAFRYMAGKDPSGSAIYRRFQIIFFDAEIALSFVKAIQHVCPCKSHTAASVAPRLNMPKLAPFSKPLANTHIVITPRPFVNGSLTSVVPVSTAVSSISLPAKARPLPPATVSESSLPPASTPPHVDFTLNVISQRKPDLHDSIPRNFGTQPESNAAPLPDDCPSSSLPFQDTPTHVSDAVFASYPAFDSSTVSAPPLQAPSALLASGGQSSSAFSTPSLAHLLATSLSPYALSDRDFEQLVAEVVRGDGFAELMQRVDGMWRAHALARAAQIPG